MGRGRIFIYLGLILILSLVAFVLVAQRFNLVGPQPTPEAPPPTPIPETDIVVTTQQIPRGEEVTDDVIQVVSIPLDLLVDGMITSPNDTIGLRAKFDLDEGIPLTRNMLVETVEQLSSAGSVAALLIPKGDVAVSIPISRLSSVSYGLERGDQVNVIVTLPFVDLDADYQSILPNNTSAVIAPGPSILLSTGTGEETSTGLVAEEGLQNLSAQTASGGSVSPQGRLELDPNLGQPFYIVPSEPQRPRLASQTLIQGATVLQVGTFPLPEEKELEQAVEDAEQIPLEEQVQPEEEPTPPPPPEPPDVITVIVSPQDAVTLNYLLYSGAELTLAMRAAEDDTLAETQAVTLQFLLEEYDIPVPAKLPFGSLPRIDELKPPVLSNDAQPPPAEE